MLSIFMLMMLEIAMVVFIGYRRFEYVYSNWPRALLLYAPFTIIIMSSGQMASLHGGNSLPLVETGAAVCAVWGLFYMIFSKGRTMTDGHG